MDVVLVRSGDGAYGTCARAACDDGIGDEASDTNEDVDVDVGGGGADDVRTKGEGRAGGGRTGWCADIRSSMSSGYINARTSAA